ncbi:MFS transporter [Metabacillus halosaccharovorans]|nr:MFS transporter [Metabacillus halosaccharovorans]
MGNMFIALMGVGLVIPVLPQFILEFGGSGKDIGYLVAAMGLTQFFISPIGGELSDKYGRKIILVIGLCILTISQLIFSVGTELWVLYLSRLIGGIGVGLIVPANMAYVADVTTEDNRAKGMGYLSASLTLGFVIAPGVGGFLAEFGIRVPFYIATIIAAVAAVISLSFLPETLTKEKQTDDRGLMLERVGFLFVLRKSFKTKYLILLILTFIMTFGIAKFEAIFGLYVDRKYGYTTKEISIMLTIGAICGVILQALFIDRLLTLFGEVKVIISCFFLSSVTLILMLLSGQFSYMIIMNTIFIGLTSILRPALNTLVSKMAGNEQGYAAGMVNAYSSLGNIIGPALAGILFDIQFDIPFIFGAIVLLSGLVTCFVWNRREHERKEATKIISS